MALVLAVPLGSALVRQPRSPAAVLSAGVYAAALVGLYAVSASYHLVRWSPRARARMRRLDRAMIYLFIGACYTPLCLVAIGGIFGTVVLVLGWSAAIIGVLTTLGRKQSLPTGLGYVGVGWLGAITLPRLATRLDMPGVLLFLAGGLAYTAGAIVLAARRPDPAPRTFGYHEVWHALVVAGSALHYALFWRLVRI